MGSHCDRHVIQYSLIHFCQEVAREAYGPFHDSDTRKLTNKCGVAWVNANEACQPPSTLNSKLKTCKAVTWHLHEQKPAQVDS